MKRTHGLSRHPLYRVWYQMIARCQHPTHRMYKWYGQRGITVCEQWQSFENFFAAMSPRPDGLTLERIDNDAGYSPQNCRWASRAEQARNRAPKGTYMSKRARQRWKKDLTARLRAMAQRPHPERRLKPQPCELCGAMFVRHGGHQEQRYCSVSCYARARTRRSD